MIRKLTLLVIALLMALTSFFGCSSTDDTENNKNMEEQNTMSSTETNESKIKPVKLAIFPIGMGSDTYLFDLNSNGILDVKTGNRNSEDISDTNFIEPTENKNKKLSEVEIESLTKVVTEIENDKTVLEKALRKGGWEVLILIDNKKYNFNYGDYEDIGFGKLVKLMIEYSPLKVDIHGWS